MHAILRQRNANRVADSVSQQRANADRAFDPRIFAFAGFGHAEMQRIIPIRPFLIQSRDEKAIRRRSSPSDCSISSRK